MQRNALFSAVVLAASLFATATQASSLEAPATSFFYAGLEVGQSDVGESGGNVEGFKDSENLLGIYGGYAFTPNWRVEAGYRSLYEMSHDFAYVSDYSQYAVDSDSEVTAIQLSVVGLLPINDAFSVYGRLGVAKASVDIDVTVTETGARALTVSTSEDETLIFGGIGGEYNVTRNIAMTLEYNAYEKLAGSSLSSISLGAKWKFN